MKITTKDTKLHLDQVIVDTSSGEMNITIPFNTGKYEVNIIPIRETEIKSFDTNPFHTPAQRLDKGLQWHFSTDDTNVKTEDIK